MRSDISPGHTFPDYQLPDHTSTLRKLSDLQGEDPLILTLARGHYSRLFTSAGVIALGCFVSLVRRACDRA